MIPFLSSSDDGNCSHLLQVLHSGKKLQLAIEGLKPYANFDPKKEDQLKEPQRAVDGSKQSPSFESKTTTPPKETTALLTARQAFMDEFGNTDEVPITSSIHTRNTSSNLLMHYSFSALFKQ
jgi:hypothetical protein